MTKHLESRSALIGYMAFTTTITLALVFWGVHNIVRGTPIQAVGAGIGAAIEVCAAITIARMYARRFNPS